MLNKETIKQIALSCGFKLKEQANGEMDLNPYVYEFANTIAEHCWSAFKSGVMPHKIHPTKASLNNDWISVDDGLPHPIDLNTDVYGVGMVDYAWFVHNSNMDDVCFELYTTGDIIHPTHWQPLPKPPKERMNDNH